MIRQRYRIRFAKQGDLRWIGHRDLLRTLERLFRRAGLPLGMSEGFHPKPRMSFPSALAVGVAAEDEVMEIELCQDEDPDDVRVALLEHAVGGLVFHVVERLEPGEKKAQVKSVTLEFPIPPERRAAVVAAIEVFLARSELLVARNGRNEPIDVRSGVEELELTDGCLRMRIHTSRKASVRPREVLQVLDIADLERDGAFLTRTEVTLQVEKSEGLRGPSTAPPTVEEEQTNIRRHKDVPRTTRKTETT